MHNLLYIQLFEHVCKYLPLNDDEIMVDEYVNNV